MSRGGSKTIPVCFQGTCLQKGIALANLTITLTRLDVSYPLSGVWVRQIPQENYRTIRCVPFARAQTGQVQRESGINDNNEVQKNRVFFAARNFRHKLSKSFYFKCPSGNNKSIGVVFVNHLYGAGVFTWLHWIANGYHSPQH
jgi:hypothetical protein